LSAGHANPSDGSRGKAAGTAPSLASSRRGLRLPSSHSAAFEPRAVALKDGRRVLLRVAQPGDAPAVQAFVRGLSAAARFNRFFSPVHELSDDQLQRVTRSSHPHALALVGVAGQHGSTSVVALAQYAACEPPEAELAVVVAEDWRRQGAATHLLYALADHGAQVGLTSLTGRVLADNWPMLTFLARHGFDLSEDADGYAVRAALPLREPR
jgi:acetyltransferase